MTTFVSDLAPQPLWKHFDEILKIPRVWQGGVEAVCARASRAERADGSAGLYGNFVVAKLTTTGYERVPTVVLQAHLDMVTEKELHTQHDFLCAPSSPAARGSGSGDRHHPWDGNGIGVEVLINMGFTVSCCESGLDESLGVSHFFGGGATPCTIITLRFNDRYGQEEIEDGGAGQANGRWTEQGRNLAVGMWPGR